MKKRDNFRIIPAIDIIDGKCVRLEKGDYRSKTEYSAYPLDVAKQYADHGIQYLHLVDLDGARSGAFKHFDILEEIAVKTDLQIDVGGGLKTDADLQQVLNAGASQITAGSIAVHQPEKVISWLNEFGKNKIILGADFKNDKIAINAWHDEAEENVDEFIAKFAQEGIAHCIATDIAVDGMLSGISVERYEKLATKFPDIRFIVSGGVLSIDDIDKAKNAGCGGIIIGKAIYENRISLKELEKYILNEC